MGDRPKASANTGQNNYEINGYIRASGGIGTNGPIVRATEGSTSTYLVIYINKGKVVAVLN
jgi:hypothetical protein